MRKDFYVYFHRDRTGSLFYVGKGTGRRAWSADRHPAWKRYVAERLGGHFRVEIHAQELTEVEAEELEGSLIQQYGAQLINWINPGRDFDYAAIDRYHKLRNDNRAFVAETRRIEGEDLHEAVARYRHALVAMREYEGMTLERGVVAEMGAGPNWGDISIIDRLTLCLAKLGQSVEAIAAAEAYFLEFPSALDLTAGKRVKVRIEKLKAKSVVGS